MIPLSAYKISKGRDRWHRRWQAEYDCESWMWCPRAFTERGALRKAERWFRRGTDIKRHERKYGVNLTARRMRGFTP